MMPVDAADLEVGDVLLMMGEAPLSQLIAWASDGIYSHAALVADGGDLIEAAGSGVRRYPLQQRLADRANYRFVDAFRAGADGSDGLSPPDREAVLATAAGFLGTPYPLDQLALLGAIMAVRGKWPVHPLARWLVREALDHVVPDAPGKLVCSELVYRAYAQCDAQPQGRLAPVIVVGARGTAPFPDIDWKQLFDEVWPLLRPQRRQAMQARMAAINPASGSDVMLSAGAEDDGHLSDDMLELARAEVLAGLGAGQPLDAAPARHLLLDDSIIQKPNPRLVSPQDLANSPSNSLLGRLM